MTTDDEVGQGLIRITAAFGLADQPDATFRVFDEVVGQLIGRVFVTVLRNEGPYLTRRIFSTTPEFPAGDLKQHKVQPRTIQIYERGEASVTLGREGIMRDYPNSSRTFSAGADCLGNFPVMLNGRIVGAANIGGSRVGGWTDAAHVVRVISPLAQALGPIIAQWSATGFSRPA